MIGRHKHPPYDPFLTGRLVELSAITAELLQRGALTDGDLAKLGRRHEILARCFLDDDEPILRELPAPA